MALDLTTGQYVGIVVGALVAVSGYVGDIVKWTVSKASNLNLPDLTPEPTPVTPTPVTPVPTDLVDADGFARVVLEWERFVNVLEVNEMPECVEDMKTLLIKMAQEYRNELNEDDNPPAPKNPE